MLTLSCASQEKSMTADGSTRTWPGCVCFHFTNKIYNPLTPCTPTPQTPALVLSLVVGGGQWSNWKSMYQFYSNKGENTRGQKSTNLPKLAKCLEWEQGRGEMAGCSQRWAGPDDHRRIPARQRGRETETQTEREREGDQVAVHVYMLKWDENIIFLFFSKILLKADPVALTFSAFLKKKRKWDKKTDVHLTWLDWKQGQQITRLSLWSAMCSLKS